MKKRCLTCTAILLLALSNHTQQTFNTITSKLEEVDFVYPGQTRSERGLPICGPKAACSVVQRRFWVAQRVERLCRCSTRDECPSTWTTQPDNQSMSLDNRSQFKFCKSITTFPKCSSRHPAIVVINETNPVPPKNQTTVSVNCHCPVNHYWKLRKHFHKNYPNGTALTISSYLCVKLRKCAAWDFCGNMRVDHFSTYYQCSCPTGHLCLYRNKTQHHVAELLYNGPAYKALCYPTL